MKSEIAQKTHVGVKKKKRAVPAKFKHSLSHTHYEDDGDEGGGDVRSWCTERVS